MASRNSRVSMHRCCRRRRRHTGWIFLGDWRRVLNWRGIVLANALAFATASCGMTEVPVPIALSVHISRTGECTVTKVTMPCDGLGAYIKGLNAQPSCDIHVEVDRESQYQFVVAALSSLRKAGFNTVGFAAQN